MDSTEKASGKEREIQETYLQLQIVEQYIKNMQKQLEIVEVQFIELNVASHSIVELKKFKEGAELFVPLSSGIFIRATLKDKEALLINVGSDIAVRKSPESAKELIEVQIKEINSMREKITSELDRLVQHAEACQSRLQNLVN